LFFYGGGNVVNKWGWLTIGVGTGMVGLITVEYLIGRGVLQHESSMAIAVDNSDTHQLLLAAVPGSVRVGDKVDVYVNLLGGLPTSASVVVEVRGCNGAYREQQVSLDADGQAEFSLVSTTPCTYTVRARYTNQQKVLISDQISIHWRG
jgi:hypothetical protein